jgi:glyoxylase-like metal-dependent hydrolase (beta-lactamase superfamily II)
MQALPNARCVIHPRGVRHMVDPAKLVAGTEAVYGVEQTHKLYGVIQPIDESRVVVPSDEQWLELNGRKLQVLFTEGHARHHYCLRDPASRGVFTGDSFGVSYRELDTVAGEFIFPTSTPASFDPAEAHKSVDRIMGCKPERLYLTHYSRVTDLERLAADMHAGIDAYVEMALEEQDNDDPLPAIQSAMYDYLSTRLIAHGYKGDESAMRSVLEIDVVLNSQGLVSWLQRQKKQG